MGVTHPSMDKARSFLSTYDVELRGRGAWGCFFLSLALPTFLPFAILFFLNQNKRGGGGGAGVPGAPDVELGGGVGALFLSLALPAFLHFAILFLKPK